MTLEQDQLEYERLSAKDEVLRLKVLKRATFEWRKALRFEHVQGVGTEVEGMPTNAFRMITKESKRTEGRIDELTVFVPQNSDPQNYLDEIWTKFTLASGRSGMFYTSTSYAEVYTPYQGNESLFEEKAESIAEGIAKEESTGEDSGEISMIDVVQGGIKRYQENARGMEALIVAMRDDFIHVPYDF